MTRRPSLLTLLVFVSFYTVAQTDHLPSPFDHVALRGFRNETKRKLMASKLASLLWLLRGDIWGNGRRLGREAAGNYKVAHRGS